MTLFSLILVLSVYYITMPNELLLTNNSNYDVDSVGKIDDNDTEIVIEIEESDQVTAYNQALDEKRLASKNELEAMMFDETITIDDKNEIYEQIKYLSEVSSKEEKIEELIKKNYKIDSYVEIENTTVKVIAAKKEHDVILANNIMKLIQNEFTSPMYITVKFET